MNCCFSVGTRKQIFAAMAAEQEMCRKYGCIRPELLLFIVRNLQWLIPSSLLPPLAELWRWMTLSDNCCRLARSADADGPRRGEILSHPIGKCSLVQRFHHDDETYKGQSGRAERSRVFINIYTLWLFIWKFHLWCFWEEAAFTLTVISCPVTDSAHLWGMVKELRFNKSPSICNTISYSYKLVPAGGT